MREKKSGADLKSILIAAEDKLRTEVEPHFRRFIQNLLTKKYVKVQERKNAIKMDKDWQWVAKLYPSVFIKDKQIIFMSVDKFLSQNSTIVEPSCMLYNSDLIKDSVIFIDEFDASKDTMLKNIIQNGLRERVDYIELFKSIYASLHTHSFPSVLTTPSKKRQEGTYKDQSLQSVIDGIVEKADDIYKLYTLQFSHKTETITDESLNNFLFQDHQYLSILNGNKSYISAVSDSKRRINAIQFTDDRKRDPNEKTFAQYSEEWLNIKRVTTKPSTYKEYVRMLNHDVLPTFGELGASEIDRSMVQNYLLTYVDKGTLRMAHKLFLLLKCIFDMIADDYNIPTPMKKVVVPNYESKSGTAFTYDEEKKLVSHCLANLKKDASHAFLVLIYAGLRRSELASLNVIDGTWLECETSKERMGKNVVKRKIPLTPMMKKVLPYIDFEKAKNANLNTLQSTMRRIFPGHHSHELRHTFISRCKESGVMGEVVSIWAGHSLTGTITTTVYTHYSDEFFLKEAQKVDYLQWDFGNN